MDSLISVLDKTEDKSGTADSFSDQLNHKYSAGMLIIFAVMAVSGICIQQPISCFCPNEWESSQVEFAEKACWTQTTFHIPFNDTLFNQKSAVSYYQWISLILVGQAFLFYLPNPMWKIMSKKSGIAISSITDAGKQFRKCRDSEESENIMKYASSTLNNYLDAQINQIKDGKKKWSIFKGNYLTCLYLFIKFVYIINAVGQLFLLNEFLGNNYHMYGFDVLGRMIRGDSWTTSDRFPRVTFCRIPIRIVGNINKWLIQCVLPMNLYYEMMYLILWFWLVFVTIVTACSFLRWLPLAFRSRMNVKYVTNILLRSDTVDACNGKNEEIKEFVYEYLKKDGTFLLKILENNAGEWVVSSLLKEVWLKYRAKQFPLANQERNSYNPSDEGIVLDKHRLF